MGRKIQLIYKQKIVTQFSTQHAKFLGERENVQSASSTVRRLNQKKSYNFFSAYYPVFYYSTNGFQQKCFRDIITESIINFRVRMLMSTMIA